MYQGITSIGDEELRVRRVDLDTVMQINAEELRLLNREHDRRERARHEEQQRLVLESERQASGAQSASTTVAPSGSACAVGDGVTVSA